MRDGATLRLGSLAVPPMGFGMWRFRGTDVAAARRLVEAALEHGLTLFDTADVYGPDNGEAFGAAETLLGRVLAEAPHLRGRFVLATKGGIVPGVPYDARREHLVRACGASLRRLGVERVELYQVHRPDPLAHPAETAAALTALRKAGKIAEAGVSNHTPAQVAALQAHLPFPLASVQPEFSPLEIAPLYDGVLDQALERGLAVLAWSPLGGGRIGRREGRADLIAALERLAARHGVERSAIACAWIMAHPARPIPIVGSQRPARLAQAAAAREVRLGRNDWFAVLAAARGAPLP
jgi:predicted oxidoreductase